jgi:4'-phosphopantetheinyl transferase
MSRIDNPKVFNLYPLPDGEVHVWYARTATCDTATLRSYYSSLLSPAESKRLARFAFDSLKLEYLVTRALCRCVLSRYVAMDPMHWRFILGAHGKPEIDAGEGIAPPLRFNLSNTSTLVACAVARSVDLGIDIERVDRDSDIDELAKAHFSPEEIFYLDASRSEDRPRRFFELWTLKEAYLKATGVGLSLELDQVAFSRSEQTIDVRFGSSIDDLANNWQFVTHEPWASHMTAIAIHKRQRPQFDVRFFATVPMP